jgi:hypothetical protein
LRLQLFHYRPVAKIGFARHVPSSLPPSGSLDYSSGKFTVLFPLIE